MKCPSCNKIIKKTDKDCRFCGASFEEKPKVITRTVYITVENKVNKWLILGIGLLAFLIVIETSFTAWYFLVKKPANENKLKVTTFDYTLKLPFDVYKTNEDFSFDNLSITVSKNYKIVKLDNPYSIYNGKDVIQIPVTIKNNSKDKHSLNLFYYDIYDEFGNSIDEVAGYFDEALYYAEDLENDQSYTKYIYALYYGNKAYSIRFENKNDTIFVKYYISK